MGERLITYHGAYGRILKVHNPPLLTIAFPASQPSHTKQIQEADNRCNDAAAEERGGGGDERQ